MVATQQRTLILASSSPRRQELIRSLQLPVQIRVSDVDESVEETLSPLEIVESLALRKASAVAKGLREERSAGSYIIIGSDTIVVLDGQVLGKPKDARDAERMLTMLQGRSHEVYSGVACIDSSAEVRTIVGHRVTKVHMKTMTPRQIERYVAGGEPMDKAGSYAIQDLGATIVESIEGCYFNVVGLPLSLLSDILAELGMEVL